MDSTTLEGLSRILAFHFWKTLETLSPGIDSLLLAPDVAAAWKQRVKVKVTQRRQPDGTVAEVTSPRANVFDLLTSVRSFYLDIAQWALEEPARWGPWAAPCPVSAAEGSHRKNDRQRKARMDQRTRERLPSVAALSRLADQRRAEALARLDAVRAAEPGAPFTVQGETMVKVRGARQDREGRGLAFDEKGARRNLILEEHRAFWTWAAVEFFRSTGCRIEEMMEVSHHSVTQYAVPHSGEVIPLLQIAPSKTDTERLLVVDAELADALATIISRIRGADGTVPLVSAWDVQEKVWNAPLPLLFQWTVAGHKRGVSQTIIRKGLNELLDASGLTDAAGQPLRLSPHDFRRIFATEAILNGMPPHIAQLILGHQDINTTMGYKAIYPQETINGHRAFIARRRAARPSEEYRTPTDEEWAEFLGHFERRKVALGDCGRAYGTSCPHEHSCVRCLVLRIDPDQRPRLADIRDNLTARIAEAEREGWLGEAEGLRVSLAAARDKLAQLDERTRRAATVSLGIPAYRDIAARTATVPGNLP